MRAWIFRRRPFPARDVPGCRVGCAEHAARVRAIKDAGLQVLCLFLSYVEREKGKIAAVRSRQVTRGCGLSQFAISAAGPVGFAGRWLHVKKKIWLAASQLRFTTGVMGTRFDLGFCALRFQGAGLSNGRGQRAGVFASVCASRTAETRPARAADGPMGCRS